MAKANNLYSSLAQGLLITLKGINMVAQIEFLFGTDKAAKVRNHVVAALRELDVPESEIEAAYDKAQEFTSVALDETMKKILGSNERNN
jgi:hypothetical protein